MVQQQQIPQRPVVMPQPRTNPQGVPTQQNVVNQHGQVIPQQSQQQYIYQQQQPGMSIQQPTGAANAQQPPLKELMQEFRALLRAPQTPQQKEKAHQLLRANPALLTILSMLKTKQNKAKQQNQLRQQQQHMAAQQMSQPMNPTHSTASPMDTNLSIPNQQVPMTQNDQANGQSAQDELSRFVENL